MSEQFIKELDRSIALIEMTPFVEAHIDILRDQGFNVSALKVYGNGLNAYFGWANDRSFIEDKDLVKLGAVLKFYSARNIPRMDGDLSFVLPKMNLFERDGYKIRSTAPNERFLISSGFYKGEIDQEIIQASYSGRIF